MDHNLRSLSEQLRHQLKKHNLTQTKVSERTGLTMTAIGRLLSPTPRKVHSRTRNKLEQFFRHLDNRSRQNPKNVPLLAPTHSPNSQKTPHQYEQDIDSDSQFRVEGPFHMPFKKLPDKGWQLQKHSLKKEFWQEVKSKHSKGVYIATIQTEQTEIPLYVGKTKKTNFMKECFTTDKVTKYYHGLSDYPGGAPQMYFIASTKKQGQPPGKRITELEKLLIKVAYLKNPDLQNDHETPGVTVEGLIGKTNGAIPKAANHLRYALSLMTDDQQKVYSQT